MNIVNLNAINYDYTAKLCKEIINLIDRQETREIRDSVSTPEKTIELTTKLTKKICNFTHNFIEPMSKQVQSILELVSDNVAFLISNCTNLQQFYSSDNDILDSSRNPFWKSFLNISRSYKHDIADSCLDFLRRPSITVADANKNGGFVMHLPQTILENYDTNLKYRVITDSKVIDLTDLTKKANNYSLSNSQMVVLGIALTVSCYGIYKCFQRSSAAKNKPAANKSSIKRRVNVLPQPIAPAPFAQITSAAERQQLEIRQLEKANLEKEWAAINKRVTTNNYP